MLNPENKLAQIEKCLEHFAFLVLSDLMESNVKRFIFLTLDVLQAVGFHGLYFMIEESPKALEA